MNVFIKYLVCTGFVVFFCWSLSLVSANECSSSFYEKAFWVATYQELKTDLWSNPIFFTSEHLQKVVNQLNTFCCSSVWPWLWDDETVCENVDPDPVKYSSFMFDHLMSVYQYMLEYSSSHVTEWVDENLCKKKFWDNGCVPNIYIDTEKQRDLPSPFVCYRCWNECDTRCESVYGTSDWIDKIASSTEIKYWSQYRWLYETYWWGEDNIILKTRESLIDASTDEIASLSLSQIWYFMCEEIKLIYDQLSSSNPLWDKSFQWDGTNYEQKCIRTVSDLQRKHSEYNTMLSIEWSTYSQKVTNRKIRDHSYKTFSDVTDGFFYFQSKLQSVLEGRWKFTPICNA